MSGGRRSRLAILLLVVACGVAAATYDGDLDFNPDAVDSAHLGVILDRSAEPLPAAPPRPGLGAFAAHQGLGAYHADLERRKVWGS